MKYLKILTNWRIIALTIIAIAAIVLIGGDGNRLFLIIFAKLVGFALLCFGYKIGNEWYKKGMIDEINVFNDKDE